MYTLFFFFLSQFVTMEVIITAVIDEIEAFRPGMRKYKQPIILLTCIGMLLLGLPLVTQVIKQSYYHCIAHWAATRM